MKFKVLYFCSLVAFDELTFTAIRSFEIKLPSSVTDKSFNDCYLQVPGLSGTNISCNDIEKYGTVSRNNGRPNITYISKTN